MFGPVYFHVVLRPRPGYMPKVPTTPFRDQVVNLQALPSEEADPALRICVDRTRIVRSSKQLFVCHGGKQKGKGMKGCLQTEVGPLDSGGRRLDVPVARRAVPPGGEGSLHQECCFLPCVGARRLFGRHLQSCGLDDTEHDTISALSQFLPVCWESNGREELAGVTLAVPFPLTRGYERLFSLPVQFPGR